MKTTAFAVFVGQAGIAANQLVIFALLGNAFGSETLGNYALSLAVASPVFLLFGLSLRVLYVTSEALWSVGWYLRCTVATAFGCWLVALGATLVFDTILGFALAVLTVKAFDLVQMSGVGVLQRNDRLRVGAGFLILNAALSCVLAVVAVLLGSSSTAVVWASALGSTFSAVGIWWFVVRTVDVRAGVRGKYSKLVRRGLPLGAATGVLAATVNLPAYALAAAGNVSGVATYSVLSNLRTAVNMAYGAVAQVNLNTFSDAVRSNDLRRLRKSIRTTLKDVLLLGAVISVALVLLGPFAVPLVFNVDAENWPLLLSVVAIGFVAAGAVYVYDAALSAFHLYHYQMLTTLLASAVTAILVFVAGGGLDLVLASLALAVAFLVAAAGKILIFVKISRGR